MTKKLIYVIDKLILRMWVYISRKILDVTREKTELRPNDQGLV